MAESARHSGRKTPWKTILAVLSVVAIAAGDYKDAAAGETAALQNIVMSPCPFDAGAWGRSSCAADTGWARPVYGQVQGRALSLGERTRQGDITSCSSRTWESVRRRARRVTPARSR